MPPKTAELVGMLAELRELVETGDEKHEAAIARIDAELAKLQAWKIEIDKAQAVAAALPRQPDTVYSVILGAFSDLSKDPLGMRIFIAGGLAVILFLGLATLRVVELHPEIVPGYISVQADK